MSDSVQQWLAEAEQALIRLADQFAGDFAELRQLRPSDVQEVAFHVHGLARIVGVRAAHRAHPDVVPNRAGTQI